MVVTEPDRQRDRASLLRDCDSWDRPGSVWEEEAVRAIIRLPRVTVERVPDAQLTLAGMLANDCHNNAMWYAANDPAMTSEHVLGWWPHGDLLLLHSVIRQGARYFCITPQAAEAEARFTFIPDREIDWRIEVSGRTYLRGGHEIGLGLRLNPRDHQAAIKTLRERLNANMPVERALRLGDEEAADRASLMRW